MQAVAEAGAVAEKGLLSRILDRARVWLQTRTREDTRRMRHVETLHLGPKRSLYLVECDGARYLVAAGGESVSAPVPLVRVDEERS